MLKAEGSGERIICPLRGESLVCCINQMTMLCSFLICTHTHILMHSANTLANSSSTQRSLYLQYWSSLTCLKLQDHAETEAFKSFTFIFLFTLKSTTAFCSMPEPIKLQIYFYKKEKKKYAPFIKDPSIMESLRLWEVSKFYVLANNSDILHCTNRRPAKWLQNPGS